MKFRSFRTFVSLLCALGLLVSGPVLLAQESAETAPVEEPSTKLDPALSMLQVDEHRLSH